MNMIEIKSEGGSGALFSAPANNDAAFALWAFFVGALKPGYTVRLFNETGAIEVESGQTLTGDDYAAYDGRFREF